MNWILDIVFGKIDTHPIFNELQTFNRRNNTSRQEYIRNKIIELQSSSETSRNNLFYELKMIIFESYRDSENKSIETIGKIAIQRVAEKYRIIDFDNSEGWATAVQMARGDQVTSTILPISFDSDVRAAVKAIFEKEESDRLARAEFERRRVKARNDAEAEIANSNELKKIQEEIIEAHRKLSAARSDREYYQASVVLTNTENYYEYTRKNIFKKYGISE